MKVQVVVAVLFLSVCVGADLSTDRLIGRTVNSPTCPFGQLGCTVSATDEVNNNQARQTNISVVRIDTTGGTLKALFSYQGANVQNQLVLPVSSAADLTFVAAYEWHDANSDDIPTDSEMSNPEQFVTNTNWRTGAYGSGTTASYMPFSTGLNMGNFTLSCYIVKNFTFDVPPDYTRMTGYGSICRLQVTKTTPIASGNRVALKFIVDTSLPGGTVDTTTSIYPWSIFSTASANRFRVGETWIQIARQAQPEGQLTSTASVALGPFTAATGSEQSFYVGLTTNDVDSFHYDVAFEPVSIAALSGATTTTASVVVFFAIICVALLQ